MASADAALLRQSNVPVTLHIHGARVLYWPCPDIQQPASTLVFVVGNPGLADYYIQYLSELQRLVLSDGRASIEIFCLSQLAHDPHALTQPTHPVSLEEQIQNKADILSTISGRWTGARRPTLILAGHSIGAYMALEIVRRRLSIVPISSVHLLFPALHQIGFTPNARKLAWLLKANDRPILFKYLPSLLTVLTFFVSIVLRIVQCLPLPIVHFFILCAAPTQSFTTLKFTSDFILDPPCVQQALHLARDEMKLVRAVQELAENEDSHAGRSNGQSKLPVKLRAYWAAGDLDGWAPASTRSIVEQTLNLQTFELPADITDKCLPLNAQRGHAKKRSYTVDEIRKARRAGSKRRALAGMLHAGASAGYGFASSLGNLGYRGVGGVAGTGRRIRGSGPPPASSSGFARSRSSNVNSPMGSPKQTIRRRPSLVAARASRRFDGSIVIEPAPEQQDGVGEMELDLLAKDQDDQASLMDGVVFSPEEELQSPFETSVQQQDDALRMPDRASIICKLGMPHAFVLEHSDKMATISSAMILADII